MMTSHINSSYSSWRSLGRTGTIIAMVCLVGFLVTGCTGPDADQSPTAGQAYVEPAWMAERRAREERDSADFVACMSQAGWTVTVLPDHSWDPGDLSDDQNALFAQEAGKCASQLWGTAPPQPSDEEKRLGYRQMLDTRDCLIAEGYDIAQPPTEDVWIAQKTAFAPFRDLLDQFNSGAIALSEQEYYRLYQKCPQNGPVVGMGW